jgi:hypothetical protein
MQINAHTEHSILASEDWKAVLDQNIVLKLISCSVYSYNTHINVVFFAMRKYGTRGMHIGNRRHYRDYQNTSY